MPILHWLTRDEDIQAAKKVPFRILEEVPELSYGDKNAGNMLIQGDNLDALKALLPFFAGRVKCIYIDPPYNTRSAFEHYDDNLEHSTWLSMMWPRLELLRDFLSEDGSIWVSIDDNEAHYLKVIMDEIFGRQNFVGNVVWQKKYAPANDAIWFSDNHDHILVYARKKSTWRPNKLPRSEKSDAAYKNPDNDPRGPWKPGDYTCAKSAEERPNLYYPIIHPLTGEEIWPKETRVWAYSREEYERHVAENRIWWGKRKTNKVPAYKRFLSEVADDGIVPQTIWLWKDVGHTQDGRKEQIKLAIDSPFETAKPEKLIEQIVRISTEPGDLVLDSFLGSGTTSAVAHKLNRHWIGIEMGEHAISHCVPRIRKVVDGEQGGISKSVGWKGGGGFRFYRLGPPIFDGDGRIRTGIGFPVLAAHIWFSETHRPWDGRGDSPVLGVHNGSVYALLYNGILGDRRPDGGNVLTRATLRVIREALAKEHPGFDGPVIVYGEQCRLVESTLDRERVTFKQIPYDVKVHA